MDTHSQLEALARVIQLAVAPVFLLSGIGALLAVMTNRLARVIDRARSLHGEHVDTAATSASEHVAELHSLSDRSRLIGRAIGLAVVAALLVCVVIASLFLGVLLRLNVVLLVGMLFVAAMLALIGALLVFLREIMVATRQLRTSFPTDHGAHAAGS